MGEAGFFEGDEAAVGGAANDAETGESEEEIGLHDNGIGETPEEEEDIAELGLRELAPGTRSG